MSDPAILVDADAVQGDDVHAGDVHAGDVHQAGDQLSDGVDPSFIPLSDPDITTAELAAVDAAMRSPRISSGPMVEAFEAAFAAYVGRQYAVAVPSGTSAF